MNEPRIKLYSTHFCGYCRAAKRLLNELELDFEEIDLTGDLEGRQELVRRARQRTVPQIWIGETHVGGYDELAQLVRQRELAPILKREGILSEG
jgi:glutaredoxin 3